jgi:hypothetical protein
MISINLMTNFPYKKHTICFIGTFLAVLAPGFNLRAAIRSGASCGIRGVWILRGLGKQLAL